MKVVNKELLANDNKWSHLLERSKSNDLTLEFERIHLDESQNACRNTCMHAFDNES